jgi:hydroxyethylthiazole kinase-like uncharacterized protein yjeF
MIHHIKTSNEEAVKELFKTFHQPERDSHKGQNGRVMIIGGSTLFHAASIWAAEVASHFADMVHYCSIPQNNAIMTALKTSFHNGIVVPQEEMEYYVKEDDAVLVGPGMMRSSHKREPMLHNLLEIIHESDEGSRTLELVNYLIRSNPEKQYVLDAGAIQMMDPSWMKSLVKTPIVTPHQGEFKELFHIEVTHLDAAAKTEIVMKCAREYHCVILLKSITDIISDGTDTYVIEGGNQGLTKGGTGDILAGLTASFAAKNNALKSAVFASIVLKRTADRLSGAHGYWYNNDDIISAVASTVHLLI